MSGELDRIVVPGGDELLVWVRRDGELTVVLAGGFDLHGVTTVQDTVTSLLTERPAVLALDMSAVSFISSVALACVLECRKEAIAAGGRFRLSGASAEVERVLVLAGLGELLP